ncbi:hypothetical protein TNCV_2844461, partial [Trichonephila clavipes]
MYYRVGGLYDGLKHFVRVGMSLDYIFNRINDVTEVRPVQRNFNRSPVGASYADCDMLFE